MSRGKSFYMSTISVKPLSPEDRDQVRQIVLNASEPIAPFWPMRTMVAQNPLHGLEYLPFDQAVRKGKDLLGGNGYLANEEYRQFYQSGRITKESFKRAFSRVGPRSDGQVSIEVGSRKVTPKMFGNYTYFLVSRNCHYPSWNGS